MALLLRPPVAAGLRDLRLVRAAVARQRLLRHRRPALLRRRWSPAMSHPAVARGVAATCAAAPRATSAPGAARRDRGCYPVGYVGLIARAASSLGGRSGRVLVGAAACDVPADPHPDRAPRPDARRVADRGSALERSRPGTVEHGLAGRQPSARRRIVLHDASRRLDVASRRSYSSLALADSLARRRHARDSATVGRPAGRHAAERTGSRPAHRATSRRSGTPSDAARVRPR